MNEYFRIISIIKLPETQLSAQYKYEAFLELLIPLQCLHMRTFGLKLELESEMDLLKPTKKLRFNI